MNSYNDFIPKLEYNGVLISDITHRFTLADGVEKYKGFYSKSLIEQHQTPEAVSHALYGTTDYWWILLAINNVMDPLYDWVMLDSEVHAYTEKLYDDINGIHHWEDQEYNRYESNNAEETLEPITNIEYQMWLNDAKLRINTIRPNHIKRIIKELKDNLKLLPIQVQG